MVYSVKEPQQGLGSSYNTSGEDTGLPDGLLPDIEGAIHILRNDGVVAFPTDTLYGLGACFASQKALRTVLRTKGRPDGMGMPLLLSGPEQLELVSRGLSQAAVHLAESFWPGALTIVVQRSSGVPDLVTGGRDSVALRVPDHPIPRKLASCLGQPITGTSANRTGFPPATTAPEVYSQLGDTVDLIIDGGRSGGSTPSTMVDLTTYPPRIVRVGELPVETIASALPDAVVREPVPQTTTQPR